MFGTKRVLVAALLFALAATTVGMSTATADEPQPKGKGKGKSADPQPTEPVKPIIIQLDASKLPPEVLKELLKLSKSSEPQKPGYDKKPEKPTAKPVKAISLSEAIAIAEKSTQGTVVKAERKEEEGTVQFKLEVLDGKGNKSKVTLDAGGKVTGTEKKQEEEKGKKKKKDD